MRRDPLVLAAGLRLYHLTALSLWFDEGATIKFSQLPWHRVLGLEGYYEPHPPLYYSAVKLVSLAVPLAVAGRLLSALAGVLTVAVVYAVAVRLLSRTAALGAGLFLAVSPLHVWYSQEARMYAPSALLIALSYLALVGYHQEVGMRRGRVGWATLYGVATLLAMYVVYSSAYALAPQVVLLSWLAKRHGRRVLPLAVALAAAVLAYLPWIPQLLGAMAHLGDRSRALGATPTSVRDSLLAITGAGGVGTRAESFYPGFWDRWPDWRAALVLALIPCGILGLVVLARRSWLALMTALACSAGTIIAAIAASQVSPGYAPRTVLYATLGWAFLAGAVTLVRRPHWLRALGYGSLVALVGIAGLTLQGVYRDAYKQQYRDLVADAAVAASFGKPLVAMDYMTAFMDAYAPRVRYERQPYLDRLVAAPAGAADAVWMVYTEDWWWDDFAAVRDRLAGAGYARLLHIDRNNGLSLDLFARPGARFGPTVPLTGALAAATTIQGFALAGAGEEAGTATGEAAAGAHRLYVAHFDVQLQREIGRPVGSLACLAPDGANLTTVDTFLQAAPTRDWQTAALAVLCPAATESIRLRVENRGTGTVRLRNLEIEEAIPGQR